MRSLANGKKILNVPKSKKDELWFWGHQLDDEWLYVFLIMLAAMTGLGGGGRKDVVFFKLGGGLVFRLILCVSP
jgi:hypothetical protein